jgi:flavin reductase (DIM6/NTAB) family NADH-FMN oxidoreductase RutF
MQVDFEGLSPRERYKLMAGLIVPRPIALVTSLNAAGIVNAAPFSLFNMLGEDPPLVMISVNKGEGGALKDTSANILANREFVVHIADEAMAQAMHDCGAPLPPDVSEIEATGLSVVACNAVAPPRIEAAPAAFECVLHELLESGTRHVFIGRVLWLHARDGLVDLQRHHVHLDRFSPVGRFGASLYVRTGDRFEMK